MKRLILNRLFRALLLAIIIAGLAGSPALAATNSLTGAEWSDWDGLNRKIRAWGTFTRSDQTTTLSYVRLYVKQSGALNEYDFAGNISWYVNMMEPNSFPYDGKSTGSRSPTSPFTAKTVASFLYYTQEGGGVWQHGEAVSNIVAVQ